MAAFLVVAAAWGAALYLHRYVVVHHYRATGKPICAGSCYLGNLVIAYSGGHGPYTTRSKPSWADPAALALAIGSIGVGLAVAPIRRPR